MARRAADLDARYPRVRLVGGPLAQDCQVFLGETDISQYVKAVAFAANVGELIELHLVVPACQVDLDVFANLVVHPDVIEGDDA